MIAFVLDASALLALLRDEPGADRVSPVVSDAAMTTVNLAEMVDYFARAGTAEDVIRDIMTPLPVTWVPFDEDLAYRAGLLLRLTRAAGLSLGDRACLALAQRLGVPALTADRAWATVAASINVEIDLIR